MRIACPEKQQVQALIAAAEIRDPSVRSHSERVGKLAAQIGAELGLPECEAATIRLAGLVHDIGKIGIAEEILNRPAALSDYERLLVQSHVEIGLRILQAAQFPKGVLPIVAQHHERLDGSGYPAQLTDTDIVFGARVMAVADIFEAMTASRAYRGGLSAEQALGHLQEYAGRLYDRRVVKALAKILSWH